MIAISGMRREPYSPQIREDDREIVYQGRRQGCPPVAEAVQEDDARPLTSDADEHRRAVEFDLFGVETDWKRPSSCQLSSRRLGSAIVWRLQVASATRSGDDGRTASGIEPRWIR